MPISPLSCLSRSARSRAPLRGLVLAAVLAASGLAVTGLAGCTPGTDDESARVPGTGLGIDTAAMDKTVKPGDDFYGYANGTWMRQATIPADEAQLGAFQTARERTEAQIARLVEDIAKGDASPDSDPGRIKTYYTAWLDSRAIDAAGLAPVQPDLQRFAAIASVTDLSRVLGEQVRADVDPFNSTDFQTENLFGLFVTQSLNGSAVLPYLLQGGLGLPGRDYYLSPSQRMVDVRARYRTYVADLLAAAGLPDAAARAERIVALETRIAQAHATAEQSDDIRSGATEWTRPDFVRKAPGIDWDAFFAAAELGRQDRFVAYHAGPIARLSGLVAREPLVAWQDWLIFHQLNRNAEVLPGHLERLHFAFYGTVVEGRTQQRPRPKRAIDALNAALGEPLGKLYVEQHFPARAKAEIEGMVGAIKQAFAARITRLDWMAPATRDEALAKVRSIVVGVGYPDRWNDYSTLVLKPGQAYANKQAAELFRTRQQLAKLGEPLDRGEWWMNPQLVNAVNLPVQNALNFPAAILQRPFFDPGADPAYNYGAIGAVIGHEISHSFDNNGAAFDSTGRLRNWWTEADLARFRRSSRALVLQYNGYRPFPDLALNGELELGENMADVAGLAAAYDAYRASLKGKEPPVIEGFTGDQRFFIAFAQAWQGKQRDELLRARIATNGHAPGPYRALTVRNIDAWYRAFDVQPGDRLYLPEGKRVRIW